MSNISHATLRKNQNGMVSIMVTMILMVVMSLIVIGFAQISRRNQREVLDNQLSTQAFYAAESGVNDVRNLMTTLGTPPNKTSCANTGSFYSNLQPTLNAANSVSYSCVLVNPTPYQLSFNDIDTNAQIMPIENANPTNIQKLTLTWEPNASVSSPVASCPTSAANAFANSSNWKCGYGVMRIDLVPTDGNLTASSLASHTMTTFAVPVSSGTAGTTIHFAPDNTNPSDLTTVACTAAQCQLTIDTMQANTNYYLRLSSLYEGVPLQINGTDVNGQQVPFKNGQVVIDSTGKAQDVLRRIQVYVAVKPTPPNANPQNGVNSSTPLCKRFSVTGGYFSIDSGIPNSITTDPQADRLCK